jgi:hypothetical protein
MVGEFGQGDQILFVTNVKIADGIKLHTIPGARSGLAAIEPQGRALRRYHAVRSV